VPLVSKTTEQLIVHHTLIYNSSSTFQDCCSGSDLCQKWKQVEEEDIVRVFEASVTDEDPRKESLSYSLKKTMEKD